MSRATPDDQLKFLLSCVRHSNNGKIDFVEVANECQVVSKGAAAKRYERLLKANGIHPNGGPAEKTISTPKQKSKAEIMKSAAAKRRKLEGDLSAYDFKVEDEDEHRPNFKPEPLDSTTIKPEPELAFQSFAYPHTSRAPQHQFFPRHAISPVNMQSSYGLPYMNMQPSVPSHFSHPISYPGQTPVSLPITTAAPYNASQDTGAPSTGSQSHQLSNSQSLSSVSDEQIQCMIDEFCREDMFKQPVHNNSSTLAAHTIEGPSPHETPMKQEPQLSPAAVDIPPAASFKYPVASHKVKQELELPIVAAPDSAVTEPTGSGIEDSILIGD